MKQDNISAQNSEFWNELCGTQLAKNLGIADSSPTSLKKFDDWYFDFYPYLFDHIPFELMNASKVLEVGLGYGTVAQRIAENGANYTGLDIAPGPVAMVKHRLQQKGLEGEVIQGDVLRPPFHANSFDFIVAIGCLHHTGNLQLAIQRCWELLRPGGQLIFMVYYAYSYRRSLHVPVQTIRYMSKELFGYRGVVGKSKNSERGEYDQNADGVAAPHTDWISVKSLKFLCNKFSQINTKIENMDQVPRYYIISRKNLLATCIPNIIGLDVYVKAVK